MIMSGYYCMGRSPFHTVYLTGTVRDMEHRKMSKSLGNGIDPLDVVAQFGADAMRFTLLQGMGLGVDVMLDPTDLEKSFAPGRNFATKLWNIGRFLLLQVGSDPVRDFASLTDAELTSVDRWILDRLASGISDCDAALGPARPTGATWTEQERTAGMRLDAYAEAARRFVWNDLADWYVEACKARLLQPGADREVARAVLVHVFDQALRLLHPAIPFITESLWRRLPTYSAGTFIAQAQWPSRDASHAGGGAAFDLVREVITGIRQLRSDYGLAPGKEVTAYVVGPDALVQRVLAESTLLGRMAKCAVTADAAPAGPAAHVMLGGTGLEIVLPLAGIVDLGKECARLQTEVDALDKQLAALRGRLGNEKFTGKAPPELVEAERAKEREWTARSEQLHAKVRSLCG
jgi:valyl-tRNA synthetase